MGKIINLKIDNHAVSVPDGTLIVDAAKMAGVVIPVFCYHPKMKPVGMCRMCLVDIGRPMIDRTTNQPVMEPDGSPRIQFAPKLDIACTAPVSEGMVVVTDSEKVKAARREVLEFLLTSHPLDCPICDKGGECPLQNLTMAYGPSQSRFVLEEKMQLAKHVPLGELIVLDRERCIQCARCTRFQNEVVGDPVIAFHSRGRSLQIITLSEPGFDSIWSGNTTDICPVGALTTTDFRFKARPWEMNQAASLCNQCAVGCNIMFNVRREAWSSGKTVIKRVMPRQNEAVNEIWICDKGRFGYHYAESSERLRTPLVRKAGQLQPVTWDEALDLVAEKARAAGSGLMTLASGRLANEDLFNLRQLNPSGSNVLDSFMGGGDLVDQVGVGQGTNLGALGKGSVILVVACDLHEEAPLWWLRIKQAAERGAVLIVLNARETRLDQYAAHALRYTYGEEAAALAGFLPDHLAASPEIQRKAAEIFNSAENGVILFGSDGLGLAGSNALAQACARLLVATGHTGKANSGLIGVWPNGNTQGAWDMGFRPVEDLAGALGKALVAYIAAADPAGDDPALALAVDRAAFVVVQDLFMTETAKLADVVLPVVPFSEREGTYTSGERRVQRFYPAVPALPGPRADYAIFAQVGSRMELALEGRAPSLIFNKIASSVAAYAGVTYQSLSEAVEQWPDVGRGELYYGGTTYDNKQGIGVQLAPAAQRSASPTLRRPGEGPVEGSAALPLRSPDEGSAEGSASHPVEGNDTQDRRIPEVSRPPEGNALHPAEGDASRPVEGSTSRAIENGGTINLPEFVQPARLEVPAGGLVLLPVTRLYDRGTLLTPSTILQQRLAQPEIWLNPATAAAFGLKADAPVAVTLSGHTLTVQVRIAETIPVDVALAPRSVGLPFNQPVVLASFGPSSGRRTPSGGRYHPDGGTGSGSGESQPLPEVETK